MSTPVRRFKVEPIETSVKSSKDSQSQQIDSPKPARKFAPQPVETTIKKSRRFAPEPIETSQKSSRRFAPEPIETTVKSSRDKVNPESSRRVKPTPEVTSPKKSRDKFAQEWETHTRRFKPEPTETTSGSNRKQNGNSTAKGAEKRVPRRFAPQLLETARRSRKAGDTTPAIRPSDKTEAVPGNDKGCPRRVQVRAPPPPPENTPTVDISHNPLFLEIQRATLAQAPRRRSWASLRSQHSFRVPELDPIESSESEGSSPPSPSTSPSAASDHSFMYKEPTRKRESVDERFSGYLLELAAKAAEKQLREQAMAAFPNDDYHEHVDHFIDRDSDDAESELNGPLRRRESSVTENNWELMAMQQHREKLEKEKEKEKEKQQRQQAATNRSEHQMSSPWGNSAAYMKSANQNLVGGVQRDGELDRMRKRARPPMLGTDIKFPRCPSPEPARFDPTQGCDAIRISMCYLSEQSRQEENGEGLWCGKGNGKSSSNQPSLYSPSNAPSRTPSQTPSHGGLWGGCCVNTGQTPPRVPTGLLTPMIERDNPMSPCPTPSRSLLPPTPPPSNADFATINEKLAAQVAIEDDFSDDFVTQVYNYLSLGYPSIARLFDGELARISKYSVGELRQDDHLQTNRGYIRLGADGNLTDATITEETCMRWRALRVYVREWAKQQPRMIADTTVGGPGIAVRKGSWAL